MDVSLVLQFVYRCCLYNTTEFTYRSVFTSSQDCKCMCAKKF